MARILITGASSGLGAALARTMASEGHALVLWGRNEDRLGAVAQDCRDRGADVDIESFDLRDVEATVARLRALDARRPLDIAVLNAGLGGTVPVERLAEAPEASHAIADVDFTVPVVSATTMAELMAGRGKGQIVLIGSIAESFPLPMAPTYAGAKAGLAMFADALSLRMARHGVRITLVSPGFIDTPMSRQLTEPKPFLMTAEKAAGIVAAKIARERGRVVIPWQFAVIRGLSSLFPRALTRAILRRT